MNLIDMLLILIVLLHIYSGWQKGFILGILQLLMLASGLFAAFSIYPHLALFIEKHTASLGIWTVPLSFIIALVIARLILSSIANRVLQTIPESAQTNVANRAMGIVPGAINGIIWVIIAALLLSIPFSDRLSAKARDSKLAGIMADKADWLNEKLSPYYDEIVNKAFGKPKAETGTEKAISLPFKVDHIKVREDLEAKMLVLVNEERQKAGLKPLKADPEMLVAARGHSKDMFERGYFSHETPEGLSPFDRMKKAKVRFIAAGENLAIGPTLTICHRGLMNSPGHRKNILNSSFGRVGIAVLDGGLYGLMITQNFRN